MYLYATQRLVSATTATVTGSSYVVVSGTTARKVTTNAGRLGHQKEENDQKAAPSTSPFRRRHSSSTSSSDDLTSNYFLKTSVQNGNINGSSNKSFSKGMLLSSFHFWRTNGGSSNSNKTNSTLSLSSRNNSTTSSTEKRSMSTIPWREDMIFRDYNDLKDNQDSSISSSKSIFQSNNKELGNKNHSTLSQAFSRYSRMEDDPRRAFSENMLVNAYHYWRHATSCTHEVKNVVKK